MSTHFILLVLSILSLSFVNAIEFWYNLPSKKQQCFGDSLGEKIAVQIDIFSEEHNYQLRIYDPEGVQIHVTPQEPLANEKIAFVTESEGNYQFCFTNFRAQPQQIKYNYRTGVETFDQSGAAGKEAFEPVSQEVEKLEALVDSISKERYMIARQSTRMHLSTNDVSFKVLGFSVITLLLMGVLTAFQLVYLKNFFKSKKLI